MTRSAGQPAGAADLYSRSQRVPSFLPRSPSNRIEGALIVNSDQHRRPNAWQWLRYSLGAGLPPELSGWVLHGQAS
jgi:hypothetical protein